MTTGPKSTTIYVYLLDEGVDVWRPVQAHHLGGDLYRIISINEHEDEQWQFRTGDVVRCAMRTFSDGPGLAAHERVDLST